MATTQQSTKSFLTRMDTQNWFRMAVCLVPALIIAKLTSNENAPAFVGTIGGIALLIGFTVYFGWGFIRKRMRDTLEVESYETEGESSMEYEIPPAGVHIKMLEELREMCNGDYAEVIRLLKTEAELYSDLTILGVIEDLHHRKSHEIKSRSGSSPS